MTPDKLQNFRMSESIHNELRAIAEELTRKANGPLLGVQTAVRMCVDRGIPVLKAELGMAGGRPACAHVDSCMLKPKVHPSVAPKAPES